MVYNPVGKTVVFTNTHAYQFQGHDFHKGKSPCGMQLAYPGLVKTRSDKKQEDVLGHMLKICRNAFCIGERSPAGCSFGAKG